MVGIAREGSSRVPRAGRVESGEEKKEGKPRFEAWTCCHAAVAAAAAVTAAGY